MKNMGVSTGANQLQRLEYNIRKIKISLQRLNQANFKNNHWWMVARSSKSLIKDSSNATKAQQFIVIAFVMGSVSPSGP